MSQIIINGSVSSKTDKSVSKLSVQRTLSHADDILPQIRYQNHYQLAIKHYLNRNFSQAWKIINPLVDGFLRSGQTRAKVGNELVIKIYKLYLSLVDLKLKEQMEIRDHTSYVDNNLEQAFMDGVLFNNIVRIYHGDYFAIDSELALMCFIIELSNGFPTIDLGNQLEKYLRYTSVLPRGDGLSQSTAKREKIVELYLLHILPKLNEISKSKELVHQLFSSDSSKVLLYLKKLDQTSVRQKQSKINNQLDSQKRNDRNKSKIDRNRKDSKHMTSDKPKPKENVSDVKTNSLVSSLKSIFNSHGYGVIKNITGTSLILVFVIWILRLLSRKNSKLRRLVGWLIRTFGETLQMAFRVTYV
ncbi:hypothetical protein OGAPHI_002885 [Ogataea philodendri]|uniref:Uncharacterized protein n=1 Tax=Ogataea philodendri TaxID=1378263 RepID=A0A9P8T6S8_9ASCO|nr:uncharacterized protein OGAPHI_002885 [Ogataea philodendri]KAH3667236.1 hypothetical protein OGAPHI_002885 [Ogataea philodendri]